MALLRADMEEMWVFGYGSLMWRPGFEYVEVKHARLHGLHRRLCIYSHVHRGTPERPGLVLGLDQGGSCQGMVFRVEKTLQTEVLAYLREREMMNKVYYESIRRVRCDDGTVVKALCYCAVRDHAQFAPSMGMDATVRQVLGAVGQSGRNEDYVISTVEKIKAMGARDPSLERVADALRKAIAAV
ncbi:MAG: gamma-glutamylcyclotransferase [Pseudomonadota bacterium]